MSLTYAVPPVWNGDTTFTYVGGVLTAVAYPNGETKSFTYTSGVLTQSDYFDGYRTIRTTYNYTAGVLTSTTQTTI